MITHKTPHGFGSGPVIYSSFYLLDSCVIALR